ncbi:MAG: pyridoxamine 5'-phosphate oxidase family protein [Acutalibacteraceae bacterium]|nr:pyridoxamine 5'-phosphate oxidase family protein [Bacillota bacterium]
MHRMFHAEREFPAKEALSLLQNCEYAFLSTVCPDGQPYCVPVSPVFEGKTAYIHGAHYGQKIENIENDSRVCLCCVGNTQRVPEKFTLLYESVVAIGQAFVVEDIGERRHALELLCRKYAPEQGDEIPAAAANGAGHTAILRITLTEIHGKRKDT